MKQFYSHFLYSHHTPQPWKVDTQFHYVVKIAIGKCSRSNPFFEFLTLSICTEFKLKTQACTT